MFPNIDRCCQLHESVDIIYIVDGYEARLNVDDGQRIAYHASGENVFQALTALDLLLAGKTLDEVRSVR